MDEELAKLMEAVAKLSPEDKAKISAAASPTGKVEATRVHTPDVGQGYARVSQFSGDGGKEDVSFEQFRFEVREMVRDGIYSEPVILQSIRRSLRGTAADIMLHMGPGVSVTGVLTKMDHIFGNILPPEAILEQFYSAKQLDGERVATWACRLEDILAKLHDSQQVSADVAKTMLRTKFHSGLHAGTMKSSIRHKFDAGEPYEQLLVAARVAELEELGEKKTAKVNQATAMDSSMASKVDKVLAGLEKMQNRLDALEKAQKGLTTAQTTAQATATPAAETTTQKERKPFQGNCWGCGQSGHPKFRCPLNLQQPASGAGQQAGREVAQRK